MRNHRLQFEWLIWLWSTCFISQYQDFTGLSFYLDWSFPLIKETAEWLRLPAEIRYQIHYIAWRSRRGDNFQMSSIAYEIVVLVLLGLLGLKIIWNICSFFYTTYLGSWMGLNLDLSKYGPWAGIQPFNLTCLSSEITDLSFFFASCCWLHSGYGLHGRHWKSVRQTSNQFSCMNQSLLTRRSTQSNCTVLFLQMAAKGLNIVLISRSPTKLQDTKSEIGGQDESHFFPLQIWIWAFW